MDARKLEAKCLAQRFCMKPAAVEKWMAANGLTDILSIKDRYPNMTHAEAMNQCHNDIWAFITRD